MVNCLGKNYIYSTWSYQTLMFVSLHLLTTSSLCDGEGRGIICVPSRFNTVSNSIQSDINTENSSCWYYEKCTMSGRIHVIFHWIAGLQQQCAELFGMEAALFVPTGTMGNLISGMFIIWLYAATHIYTPTQVCVCVWRGGGGVLHRCVHATPYRNSCAHTCTCRHLHWVV